MSSFAVWDFLFVHLFDCFCVDFDVGDTEGETGRTQSSVQRQTSCVAIHLSKKNGVQRQHNNNNNNKYNERNHTAHSLSLMCAFVFLHSKCKYKYREREHSGALFSIRTCLDMFKVFGMMVCDNVGYHHNSLLERFSIMFSNVSCSTSKRRSSIIRRNNVPFSRSMDSNSLVSRIWLANLVRSSCSKLISSFV